MKVISSAIAAILSASLLFAGVAQAETTESSIQNTGPGSTNQISGSRDTTCTAHNANDITVDNTNHQSAHSGDAIGGDNTSGGSAISGNASNHNSTSASIDLTNNGCMLGTTTTTTPTPSIPQVNGARTNTSAKKGSASPQVQAPIGGVGAGNGGLTLPLLAASIVSVLLGLLKLRDLEDGQAD